MLSPQYLEHISDSVLELFLTAELDIIADIARRLNMVGELTSTAEWQMAKLKEMNAVYEYVYERLSSLTGKTNDELNAIFAEAGTKALKTDDSIYKAVNLSPSAIKSNPHLQQIIFEGIRQTKGLFRNLTATTARTATRQFEVCLDRAYMQVKSGAFSADSAIRSAINDLANQGISSIVYPSGHTDSIEVAVRRAVVTGINQSALKLQEARADEMGCDLVETTAHGGARPTHAVWQGKVFSRSGKSKNYPPLSETGYGTGAGLGGWNCRHSFYPFFEGISVRNYTDEELDEINGRTVTYNGQEMSLYEATQKQRSIERNIRKYKREAAGLEAVDMDSSGAKAKVRQWQSVQKDFLDQTGLKRDYSREQIPKISAAHARDLGSRPVPFNSKATFEVEIPQYDKHVNEQISTACKKVVEDGLKDGNEHLILVNIQTGKYEYFETGDSGSVANKPFFDYLDKQSKKYPQRRFCFVHNHASGETFSLQDLNTFLTEQQINSFIASGNNGKVRIVYGEKEPLSSGGVLVEINKARNILLKDLLTAYRNGIIDTADFVKQKEIIFSNYIIDNYCNYMEVDT